MGVVEVVVVAVWIMLPAYIPNNVAVLVGGGRPIDGGRTIGDRRILGDGKTWRGTIGGIGAGIALAFVLNAVQPAPAAWIAVPTFNVGPALALPTGAMFGDMAASFFKRRFGRERGSALPVVDQYDLVVGSLGLTALVASGWLLDVLTLWVVVAILVLTPILHVLTNGIAYVLGLKDVPW